MLILPAAAISKAPSGCSIDAQPIKVDQIKLHRATQSQITKDTLFYLIQSHVEMKQIPDDSRAHIIETSSLTVVETESWELDAGSIHQEVAELRLAS